MQQNLMFLKDRSLFEGSAKPSKQIGSWVPGREGDHYIPRLRCLGKVPQHPNKLFPLSQGPKFSILCPVGWARVAQYVPGMEVPHAVIVESLVSPSKGLLNPGCTLQSPGTFTINSCLDPTLWIFCYNYSGGKFSH